jgi:hypothetical protein
MLPNFASSLCMLLGHLDAGWAFLKLRQQHTQHQTHHSVAQLGAVHATVEVPLAVLLHL